jgi:alkanesulfonate monooxygenase SsuD/methylene tetrahydromethanopterin reductase-like flavin-dependent oxidoreductase (luciferase family)
MAAVSAPRQPVGTGFALRDPLPWSDLAAVVRAAEQTGYTALFLPEIGARDALVTLGALASETRDLTLATGVLPIASRSLRLLAMGAATVQERSGGRLVLGIGTGGLGRGALERLRGAVLALRALLSGERVLLEGREVELGLVPADPVPIWIAALGPRAMELAGEVADGVLLNWCPPERVGTARRLLAEAAERGGRDPAEVTVALYVRAWVGDDEAEALPALRAAAAEYASYPAYARQFEQVGLGELAARAAAAGRAGRLEEVPVELVRAVCALGEDARARVEAFREAGADLVVVYPVASGPAAASIELTLLALAPG